MTQNAGRPLREAGVLVGATLGAVAAFFTITNPNEGIGPAWAFLVFSAVLAAAAGYLWRRSTSRRHRTIAAAGGVAAGLAVVVCAAVLAGRQQDPPAPFHGTITFRAPGFGHTVAPGGDVYGTVTGWTRGYQVWLFARPKGSDVAAPSGPCQVSGEVWTCRQAILPGGTGTHEFLTVVVAAEASAAGFSKLTRVPTATAEAQTEAFKG